MLSFACIHACMQGGQAGPWEHFLLCGKRFSAMGPFTLEGFLDWDIVEGGYDADSWYEVAYDALINVVLLWMKPYVDRGTQRCVLILDGASIHKNQCVVDACFRKGILLYYLPPYCPDLNPIEDAFKQAKNFMRINKRTLVGQSERDQIICALLSVRPEGARAAFRGNGPWL